MRMRIWMEIRMGWGRGQGQDGLELEWSWDVDGIRIGMEIRMRDVRDEMLPVPAQSSCPALPSLARPGTPSSARTPCTAVPCPGTLLPLMTALVLSPSTSF